MGNRNEPKFIVDFMLGRLAKWLRMLGYDTVYFTGRDKTRLLFQSLTENRIVVTRDHRLSWKRAWKLVVVNSDHADDQLKQVLAECKLIVTQARFFTRCTLCNGVIQAVPDKAAVKEKVPEYVFKTQEMFSRCLSCDKIYWQGTHLELLLKDLQRLGICR
jgi:uncharacterized protein with PIN domain